MKWKMQCIVKKGVGLHKRTGPSTSYRIVGKWYNGDTFIVTDVKTLGNQTWYKISGTSYWSCGKKGSSKYLKKIEDLDPPKEDTNPPEETSKPNNITTKDTREYYDYSNRYKSKPPFESTLKENSKRSNWYEESKHINTSTWDSNKAVGRINSMERSRTTNNTYGSTITLESSSTNDNFTLDDNKYNKATHNYGRYDVVSQSIIEDELSRIRYNMDIAYVEKSEVYKGVSSVASDYFSNIQKKIHNSFNRNKTAFPDYHLSKTFAYVFFTRPDLNILTNGKPDNNINSKEDPKYKYLFYNNKWTLKSLVANGNKHHDFLVLTSNEAKSFEVSDQAIKTVEHGETYTGGKVVYGRSDHESNTAGEISIRYIDSINLDIFKLHTIWVDYINKVYRGVFSPKDKYIKKKILDYAVACYYFLCGPDGQTILYWEKLTGVFPVNTGENTFSWDSGNLLAKPEINIKYQYSMKTAMDVFHLHEFNLRAGYTGSNRAIKTTYSSKNCATGSTLTSAPCVVRQEVDKRVYYRLMWTDI